MANKENNIIYLSQNPGRLGNMLFYIASKLQYIDVKEIKYFYSMQFENDLTNVLLLKHLLYNIRISVYYDNNKCPENDFDYILDTTHCDFDKLKCIINYDYLNILVDDDLINKKYLCIHCRYGDYLSNPYNKTFKSFDTNILEKILNNYPEICDEYDNVIVISDNIHLAKQNINSILIAKGFNNIKYSNKTILEDLNYLFNANCIIGSCSTFSFIGCYLNKNNAKMYVEFPYYKHPNDLGFEEGKQDALYNSDKIIKIM